MGAPSFACVVGAPRCGTTTLASFLRDHPEVCFSAPKEPHFFSQYDLTGLSGFALRERVEGSYLARYFPHRTDDGAMIAEGSVSYLYAPERMAPILRLWPDARFIITLRDPIAMLPSLHQRLLCTGDETVAEFERAWALMGERAGGRNIPRSCIDARSLQYAELGRLGHHAERFMTAVGRERCLVLLFDDLVADPAGVHRRLFEFLDLPPDSRTDFSARRASAGVRLNTLQRLLMRPPMIARNPLAGEKFQRRVRPLNGRKTPALFQAIFGLRKRLLAWNKVPAPPVALSPALRREIRDRLASDVAQLSRLIGRDLGHWLGRNVPVVEPALVNERRHGRRRVQEAASG